jgi:hypothetical protein
VLREAVAAGVNHIDTSDFYGPHITNQLIRSTSSLPGRSDYRDQNRCPSRRQRCLAAGLFRAGTGSGGA